jgi:hypothetical protein
MHILETYLVNTKLRFIILLWMTRLFADSASNAEKLGRFKEVERNWKE